MPDLPFTGAGAPVLWKITLRSAETEELGAERDEVIAETAHEAWSKSKLSRFPFAQCWVTRAK